MNFALSRAGRRWMALSMSVVAASVLCAAPSHAQGTNAVLEWNLIASITAVAGGQNGVVQTRTFAMVQAAVHDALNAIDRRYELYGPQARDPADRRLAGGGGRDGRTRCSLGAHLVAARLPRRGLRDGAVDHRGRTGERGRHGSGNGGSFGDSGAAGNGRRRQCEPTVYARH